MSVNGKETEFFFKSIIIDIKLHQIDAKFGSIFYLIHIFGIHEEKYKIKF